MWGFPLQATVIIALLISIIGVPALAGVCILMLMIPIQAYVIKLLQSLRKANANKTDQRISLIGETFSAIRIIKFFAWEESYLSKIKSIRDEEMKVFFS